MRRCGGCRACCSTNGIVELDKPPRRKCPHECSKGCAIYAERPQSCRDYACLWLLGHGEDWERPDKIGVLVEEREGQPLGVQYFAKETRARKAKSARGKRYLVQLSKATGRPVFVLDRSHQAAIAVVR